MEKVIYIANARIPTEKAHGKQIMKTCEALSKYYSDLELIIPRRKQIPELENVDPFIFYGIRKRFLITKLPTIDLLNFSRRLPKLINWLPFALQEVSFQVSLLRSNVDADIVYTRSMTTAILLRIFQGKKTFYEAHNITSNKYLRFLYGQLLKQIAGVVVISRGLGGVFRQIGVKNLTVVSDAVDPREFTHHSKSESRQILGISSRPKLAVYTGSLWPEKGVVDILLAAQKLVKSGMQFLLVGGTISEDEGKPARRFILDKALDNVQLLGFIEPTKVSLYLIAADILLLPSGKKNIASASYTSPMKLFEYLASGTPIIASATKANKEILNNRNSLLVPPSDPTKLSQKIRKLLNDRSLAQRITSQARKDALKYTWDIRAQKIRQFVQSS